MKSISSILKLLAIFISVSFLYGCGGGSSNSSGSTTTTGSTGTTTTTTTTTSTGTVTYWTRNSTYVPITFKFDGVAAGTLYYSTSTAPTCGNAGVYGLTKVLTVGTHTKLATSSKGTWPASVTVTSGCTRIELI